MKKRLFYVDFINILATIFVLFLHSSQISHVAKWGTSIQIEGRLLQSVFIPAVFLFLMISGSMLITYQEKYNTKVFLFKRFKRVIIPFILWSILWYLYDTRYTAEPGPYFHLNPGIKDFIISFSNNTINGIFWFFYVIIALYLFTPLLGSLISKNKNYLFFIVVIYFIVNCILKFTIQTFKLNIDITQISVPLLTSSYVGFYIMGYLITSDYFRKKHLVIFKILGGISFLILIVTSFMPQVPNLNSYSSPLVFFYSVGLYIWIKEKLEDITISKRTGEIFKKIAAVNLGVYIIHPVIFKIFDLVFKTGLDSRLHIYLMPILTYIACFLIITGIQKIKYLNWIFPT